MNAATQSLVALAVVALAAIWLVLRAIAKRITAHPEATSFLAARVEGGVAAMVSRGSASTFDCGAFLKRAAKAAGGRGGGRPEHAEGRFPEGTDWEAVVRAAL